MAIKRRWMMSALEESKKPLPNMPWQNRKVAASMPAPRTFARPQETATA